MIYTNILKIHQMSYSMILSYLKYQRLIASLGKIRPDSDKSKTLIQTRFMSSYSNRKKSPEDSLVGKRARTTEGKQDYEEMLRLLRVDAKTEEERIARFSDKTKARFSDKIKFNEQVHLEVMFTGIPAVIRALKPSLFMKKYHSYSGVLHYPTPVEWYCEIEQPLQTSDAYNSLCLKLQVPYYLATGFCGRQALFNLCKSTSQGSSVYSMCDNKQAVDEIFDVVTQQVHMLSKEELMKLMLFRYNLRDFSKKCYNEVYANFMRRMNSDNFYNLNELLDFIASLRQVDKSVFTDSEKMELEKLNRKIWNYIANRPMSISLSVLAELYSSAPADHENIFPVLNEVLVNNIDLMDVRDIFMILKEIHTRADSQQEVTLVKNWLEKNAHALTVTDIETLLARFIDSEFVNPFVLKILPSMITSESVMTDLSTNVVILTLSYCILGRHFDRTILETACNQYIEDSQGYSSEQLSCLLKAIGMLNFIPYRQQAFFSKVELHLMENFYNIDVLTVLEMFVHLIYINKVAVNFKPYIFAPLFLGIVNEMPDEDRTRGIRYLRVIEFAFTARKFKPNLTLPAAPEMDGLAHLKGPHEFILPVFAKLLGDASQIQVKETPTFSGHYLEVQYSALARKAGRGTNFNRNDKFAFLVLTEDSYSSNNKNHMLGHEMANIRLLQEHGLNVYSAHIDSLAQLEEKKKLEGFMESLFRQILDAARETVPGYTDEEDTVGLDAENGEVVEEESFDDEEEDFDNI